MKLNGIKWSERPDMRERRVDLLVCALAATVLLTLCSMCSPLYPLNIWVDPNCLMTVGRAMKHGSVLYRDIYEQKGPLIYLIHMLAACVTEKSFFGVFLFEIAAWTATLYAACRMIAQRTGAWMARSGAVLFAGVAIVGRSFVRGDTAEEFCLPFLMAALALFFRHTEREDGPMSLKEMFLCGLLAGFVATIKYTVLGLFLGLCATQAVLCIGRQGGLRRLMASAGVFLAGMVIPVLPWLVYFAVNGALSDAYLAYIYNNIFLYSADTGVGLYMTLKLAARGNFYWAVLAAIGVISTLIKGRWSERIGVTLMSLCALASVFLLKIIHAYYPLALCVFAPLGLRAVLPWVERHVPHTKVVQAVLCAASLAVAVFCSPNAFLRGVPLSQTAQGRLAAQIEPGATLLEYSFLDEGLYLITGTLPQEKFFVRLNVAYQPMRDALDDAVRSRRPDYVLMAWGELPSEFDGYELYTMDLAYDDTNNLNKPLYLYKRKAE